MNRKTFMACIGMVALFVGTANSYAFGLPKVFNKGSSAEASSGDDLNSVLSQQERLVKRFQSASAEILTAQGLLLEAFGYKKEAAELKEQAMALNSGPTNKESLEAAKAASEQASKRIEAKLNEGARLTKEGRMLYAKSLVPYTKGLLETKELAPDGKKFLESAKSQISNASWTEKSKVKNKLDTGMYVARKTPSYLTTLTSTSKKLLTYAKSQKVRVPKDATDALASL